MINHMNHFWAQEFAGLDAFLDEFSPLPNGEDRYAETNATGRLLIVKGMPLPDGFQPDYVDLLLVLSDYPSRPPVGIHLLEHNNGSLIAQLRHIFHVANQAAYSAPTVPGYQWICYHYQNNTWRYNPRHVASGDNLRKFLINFYNQCQREVRGVR